MSKLSDKSGVQSLGSSHEQAARVESLGAKDMAAMGQLVCQGSQPKQLSGTEMDTQKPSEEPNMGLLDLSKIVTHTDPVVEAAPRAMFIETSVSSSLTRRQTSTHLVAE